MMNLILSGLVGVLLASTIVYKMKYKATKKALNEAILLANKAIEKAEILKDGAETAMQGYKLMEHKYESLKAEHAVIFNNLEEDSMCLVKAEKALNEVYDALMLNKEPDLFTEVISANLLYDSASTNYYDIETKEITISMFDDMNNEQGKFMYEYLNDKFGVNLNGSDIRTRVIFTVLHELGHYVDYSNKEVSGEFESYNKQDVERRLALENIDDIKDAWKAYREIPAEAFADKWAIEFMIKYFPELV